MHQSQRKKINEFDYIFRAPVCVIKRTAGRGGRKRPPLRESKKKKKKRKANSTVKEDIYYKFNQKNDI